MRHQLTKRAARGAMAVYYLFSYAVFAAVVSIALALAIATPLNFIIAPDRLDDSNKIAFLCWAPAALGVLIWLHRRGAAERRAHPDQAESFWSHLVTTTPAAGGVVTLLTAAYALLVAYAPDHFGAECDVVGGSEPAAALALVVENILKVALFDLFEVFELRLSVCAPSSAEAKAATFVTRTVISLTVFAVLAQAIDPERFTRTPVWRDRRHRGWLHELPIYMSAAFAIYAAMGLAFYLIELR